MEEKEKNVEKERRRDRYLFMHVRAKFGMTRKERIMGMEDCEASSEVGAGGSVRWARGALGGHGR